MALHEAPRVEQVALSVGPHPERRAVPLGVALQQTRRRRQREGRGGGEKWQRKDTGTGNGAAEAAETRDKRHETRQIATGSQSCV